MRLGIDAGSSSSSPEAAEATTSVCRRRSATLEADGVLFERGSFMCGESGNDLLCEAEDFGTR